jgi:putative inorganic carbon (hco3(-)) transporter
MTFFLVCLFIVLVFWRPQEWLWPALNGLRILQVIVVAAVISFSAEYKAGMVRTSRRSLPAYLFAGLWVASIMSHVANGYFQGMVDTIPETFKMCFFPALLFYALDRPSRFRAIAAIFVAMSCVMAVHALMQIKLGYGFVGAPPLHMPADGDKPGYDRSLFFGIFGDPNDLAQIMATSIPFSFALTRKRSFFGFLIGCAVTWLLVSAILTTHSRGGYVALAVVGSVMIALILPARWLPTLMLVLLVVALMLCPYAGANMDQSARDRIVFWGYANWAFKQHWLFGIGYNMFWQVTTHDMTAHNAFVFCYTELGFFGYWFWFCLLQLSLLSAWRTRVALRDAKTVDAMWLKRFTGLGIAALAGFSASSYFLSRAYIPQLFYLFALLCALPFVAREYCAENRTPVASVGKDLLIGTVGSVVSILYIYFSILLLNKAYGGG